MPGPRRKANHLKSISGTYRADRQAPPPLDIPPIAELPKPPTWLPNSHATNEWKRLGPRLLERGLLTEEGLMAFGHLCALHGKIVQLWAAGESPTGHLLSQYRSLVNDFGLTPMSQGKVTPNGGARPKAPDNPFVQHGKRPA